MDFGDASETIRQAASKSQSFVNQQADAASTLVGSRMNDVASTLRKVAADLRGETSTAFVATLADYGASAVERMGTYLTQADGEQLVSDAESYTRRNPLVAAGAAYLAGLSLSRFLKTSSSSRLADQARSRRHSKAHRGSTYG